MTVPPADLDALVRRAVQQAMSDRGWAPSPALAPAPAPSVPATWTNGHSNGHSNGHRAPASVIPLREPESTSPTHRHGRQSGSDFCTQCGGCMEPAVYERRDRPGPLTLPALVDRLDRFTELAWKIEPQDIRRLRQLSRPPMGRFPGIFYANFNLFWLGENVQTLRDKARAGKIPIEHLNEMLGAACLRSAVRLSKWKLLDIIFLLSDVVAFADKTGCRDHGELKLLAEHLLLAIDRVQSWVDRMIPWHTLDARLEPVP